MTEEQVRKLLKNFILNIAKGLQPFAAIVEKVNEQKRTCTLKPADGGAEYFNVRLTPVEGSVNGVIPVPKVNSYVLAGKLTNENDVFIIIPGEVDKYIITTEKEIELNGNKYSLIKTEDFLNEMEKSNTVLSIISDLLQNWPTTPNDGGVALQTAAKAALATQNVGNFTNLTNEKVKHG